MRRGNIYLVDLDFEYKCWKTRLQLFVKEIAIIKSRNEEVKYEPNIEELNEIELMALDQHKEDLENLHRRLIMQEEQLEFYSNDFPITSKHTLFDEHITLRNKMNHLSQIHLEKIMDMISALGV